MDSPPRSDEDSTTPVDEEYLNRLRAVTEDLGRTPTTEEFTARTDQTATTGIKHFGSWSAVLDAAGLDPDNRHTMGRPSISEADYIEAVRELADDLGRPPSSLEMYEKGPYSHTTGVNLFGSWAATIEAADLTPTDEHRDGARNPLSDSEYLDAIRALAVEIGRPPTSVEMENQGRYSRGVATNRWGTWREAVAAAGLDPDDIPDSGDDGIARDEFLAALRDLATDLGRAPTTMEMNDQGRYTSGPAYKFWDTWQDALEAAGVDDVGTDGQ